MSHSVRLKQKSAGKSIGLCSVQKASDRPCLQSLPIRTAFSEIRLQVLDRHRQTGVTILADLPEHSSWRPLSAVNCGTLPVTTVQKVPTKHPSMGSTWLLRTIQQAICTSGR